MSLRTGRKNGHTIYHQIGPEPTDTDEFLGAFGDTEMAALVVERYNGYEDMAARCRRLERELSAARELAEHHRTEHARLVQGPVLTPEAKADTEAAFQRGVEHARTNLGVAKYSANRKGILLVGEVASMLQRAGDVLNSAVKELSEDTPAEDAAKPVDLKQFEWFPEEPDEASP